MKRFLCNIGKISEKTMKMGKMERKEREGKGEVSGENGVNEK